MEQIEFWKMSGSGNDFIIIDNRDRHIKDKDMSRIVSRACRRRESVGADGVIFVVDSDSSDFAWRFFNADGGEVEMCGNGSRCVARFAYLKGIAGQEMTFDTMNGPVSARVEGRRVKVLMPKPTGLSIDIPVKHKEGWKSADFIDTGVPHLVVEVGDLKDHPVFEQGRTARYDEFFAPSGTNVDFMKKAGEDHLEIRTYERGVEDETLACGTGCIACALVSSLKGAVKSPVSVTTKSGEDLIISFSRNRESFEEVWMEGNTSIIYRAGLDHEAL